MNIVGVSGLILDSAGRVLLIRTAQAGWELPGGRVEAGEDLLVALRREAREETGDAIEPGRLVGVYAVVPCSTLIVTFRCYVVPTAPAPVADEDSLQVRRLAERIQAAEPAAAAGDGLGHFARGLVDHFAFEADGAAAFAFGCLAVGGEDAFGAGVGLPVR